MSNQGALPTGGVIYIETLHIPFYLSKQYKFS